MQEKKRCKRGRGKATVAHLLPSRGPDHKTVLFCSPSLTLWTHTLVPHQRHQHHVINARARLLVQEMTRLIVNPRASLPTTSQTCLFFPFPSRRNARAPFNSSPHLDYQHPPPAQLEREGGRGGRVQIKGSRATLAAQPLSRARLEWKEARSSLT